MKRILLVDDEENFLSAMQRSLHQDYEICVASSAQSALSMLAQDSDYALVIADLWMPGMSGCDLLAEVRQRYPSIVRMMLTGCDERVEATHAVERGEVFNYLVKPCTRESLILAIKGALDLHRLHSRIGELQDYLGKAS